MYNSGINENIGSSFICSNLSEKLEGSPLYIKYRFTFFSLYNFSTLLRISLNLEINSFDAKKFCKAKENIINKEGLSLSGFILSWISWKSWLSVKINSLGNISPNFG